MRDVAGTVAQLTLGAALRQVTAQLRHAGVESAGDDARRLLAAVLELSTAQILARPERPLSPDEAESVGRCVARRVAREPVSRILGERDFYGRSFAISPATLDPRPDSETLIAAALELAASEGWLARPLRILDVGTGSGCLLLTLLAELPGAVGVGTDTSVAALDVARANAQRLGVADRAQWLAADALEAVRGKFDILISNPPYIPTQEIAGLDPEVRRYDPPSGARRRRGRFTFLPSFDSEAGGRCRKWLDGTRGGARSGRCGRRAALFNRVGSKRGGYQVLSRCLRKATVCGRQNTDLIICPERPWIFSESALGWGEWNRPCIMLLLLGSDERVRGPMRSLDCSQQGDLSSAPLIAQENH